LVEEQNLKFSSKQNSSRAAQFAKRILLSLNYVQPIWQAPVWWTTSLASNQFGKHKQKLLILYLISSYIKTS